jgi:hypothetical protein
MSMRHQIRGSISSQASPAGWNACNDQRAGHAGWRLATPPGLILVRMLDFVWCRFRIDLGGRIALEIGVDRAVLKVRSRAEAPGALRAANFLDFAVRQVASTTTTQYTVGHELLLLSDFLQPYKRAATAIAGDSIPLSERAAIKHWFRTSPEPTQVLKPN